MDHSIRLMVHADDFGLSQEINQGVIDSCRRGIVTAVALVANGAAFDQACDFLRHRSRPAVGLHINLTQGKPVLPAARVPSLVNAEGYFHDRRAFIDAVISGRIDSQQLLAEVTAQAEKVIEQNLQISHLNSHHHIHALLQVAECVMMCAELLGIRRLRYVSLPGIVTWRLGGFVAYVQHLVTALAMKRTGIIRHGFHIAQRFWGFELAKAKNKRHVLRQILRRLPPGRHELMCHPSRSGGSGSERKADDETAALCDPLLRRIIAERNIILFSPRDAAAD